MAPQEDSLPNNLRVFASSCSISGGVGRTLTDFLGQMLDRGDVERLSCEGAACDDPTP